MAGFYLGITVVGLNALVAASLVLAFMSPMPTHGRTRIAISGGQGFRQCGREAIIIFLRDASLDGFEAVKIGCA